MSLLPTRYIDKAITELRDYDIVKEQLAATENIVRSLRAKTSEQDKVIELQEERFASSRKESETWIGIADNYKILYEDERKIRKRDRRIGTAALGALALLIVIK